ncbi:MAG: ABC transporter six-transmembrane domain-containing protein, partial [Rhizobiaceae bacterium]
TLTWGLTMLETAMLASLPLLIGFSIDGLLAGDWTPFQNFIAVLAGLLIVATSRRIYDTRAYGTMQVELGKSLAERKANQPVSIVNARLGMGRELVDFLEQEIPQVMTATIQVIASVVILMSFHNLLAASAAGAAVAIIIIYGLFSHRFFRLNSVLNEQAEKQVTALESRDVAKLGTHLFALRRVEVRLSDTESLVYAAVFAVLLSMLAFNLWFAATQSAASPGQIFSIVTYSYEFVQSAVLLPMALQSLTRVSEITHRINHFADAPKDLKT